MKKFWLLVTALSLFMMSSCNSDVNIGHSTFLNKVELPRKGAKLPKRKTGKRQNILESDRALVQSGNTFAYKAFASLVNNEKELNNLVFSPMSVEYALSCLALGVDDNGFDNFKSHLGLGDLSRQEMAEYYSRLTQSFVTSDEVQRLFCANALWIDNDYKTSFIPQYGEWLATYYDAAVAADNLQNPSTYKTINEWIGRKTYGKYPNVLDPQEMATKNLSGLLINTLYLNTPWDEEFSNTDPITFRPARGQAHDVVSMSASRSMLYADNDDLQVVSIPCHDNAFAVAIAMPKGDNLTLDPSLLVNHDPIGMLNDSKKNDDNHMVRLCLPELSVWSSFGKLEKTLDELGMSDLLGAELTNLFNPVPRTIDPATVIHKCMVEWNKEGIEAAAVTAVEMTGETSPGGGKFVEMIVNRPFYFAIYHPYTGKVLFIGAVNDIR